MAKDIESEVRNIINEIVEKAADGNYIYRGEPECYTQSPFDGKVSSSLWRQFQFRSTFASYDRADFDYYTLQGAYLRDARQYGEYLHQDDFELASELQHVGGNTNLIDFTKCYLVALFFACDGFHGKPGRVILFKLTDDKRREYKIKVPQHPTNRITAQKSIFVQHEKGFVEEDDIEEIICIRPSFKQPILTYLREEHCIYTQKIYNDLQGYIKHQKNHHDAYSEYGRGKLARLRYASRIVSINGESANEDYHADVAIKHYSRAIELYPDFIEAYNDRADVYFRKGDIDEAIKDFTSVIELDSNYASAYFRRGEAYSNTGCDARAEQDFIRATELGDPYAHDRLLEVQARLNQ